jgi:hypothetical protein
MFLTFLLMPTAQRSGRRTLLVEKSRFVENAASTKGSLRAPLCLSAQPSVAFFC